MLVEAIAELGRDAQHVARDGTGVGIGDKIGVQVQPEFTGPLEFIHIDLDFFGRGMGQGNGPHRPCAKQQFSQDAGNARWHRPCRHAQDDEYKPAYAARQFHIKFQLSQPYPKG